MRLPRPDHPMFIADKQRERDFLIGAPMAVIPALCVLPVIVFLVIFPRIEHGRTIAALALPVCALTGSFGLAKVAIGAVEKPWGIFNVLNFATLLVLWVIAGYTGVFLAVLAAKL